MNKNFFLGFLLVVVGVVISAIQAAIVTYIQNPIIAFGGVLSWFGVFTLITIEILKKWDK